MNAPENLVADAAQRLFRKHAPTATDAQGEALQRACWKEFTETGLDQVLALGGDSAWRDAAAVARAAGYHAIAAPIAEAMLANWLAAKAGWEAETGVATVWLAADALTLDAGAAACALDRTPWGREAEAIYALARGAEGVRIVRFALAGAKVEAGCNLAGEPRDRLVLDAPGQARRSGREADAEEAYAAAALLRAAQMVGAMERALDLAIEHANSRVQFGRPIARFQAVQQMLAQLAGHAAGAAAAVDLGADGFASGHGLIEAAVAKSRAGEAAGLAAEIAHQVIAAMGFTLEHALQRFTRRLWSWRDEYGNEAFWNARLGAAAIAAGAWRLITDRP